ncbi:MAG TPA: hypothetical protein VKU77_38245 [Streptosporangiaceae bacterium]|nr:hypothetical protein [Streptosporangiaceae bacterium]
MDRERAETHLRRLAEAELRRVMAMPAGSIRGRWYSANLVLVAQALTAVGAVGADVADALQADVGLAVAARHRLPVRRPAPEHIQSPPKRTWWRVVPVGQVVTIRDGEHRRDLLLVAYVQSAAGARFIAAEWPFGPFTVTATDDRGVSYQIVWAGEMAPRELRLRPDPPRRIRWLDLTTAAGERATRVDLGPRDPVPGFTVTQDAHSPGEVLLDALAARILTDTAHFSQNHPGPPAAPSPRLLALGDGPGHLVSALHAAGVLPPDSPVPGQLAGLCARLGISGHGITAPPAGDLPTRWQSVLTCRRELHPPPAARLLSATVAELPALDGAKIAIAGVHHGARGTILHVLATGVTLEAGWPYAVRPLPAPWIRDSDGRWHATGMDGIVSPWGVSGANPWTETRMVTAWLTIIPPLDPRISWIEISVAGESGQVRATLPLSSP